MFLAVRDVLVEARTPEVVSPEELREDARVRVDHVDVGVAVVRESLSDVALEPLYGRRAPLGIQASPALLWIEGEVDLVMPTVIFDIDAEITEQNNTRTSYNTNFWS